ncbi:hypothetical protein Bpfe_019524 [Biomphalaria pfeifferi]|uniref:DUF7802 domain-containing protein n=1 Tax=Biomphalaria pfeifferi TaxID=112525 RepID=A0AAD8F5P0_BIOPF|nr:hypothetical protein Bpfe_019524 [Biomphalaria pfeifferi]
MSEKDRAWWIKFRSYQDILKNHPTYLYCELIFYLLGFITFCHAMRNGGRYRWLWFAAVAHGLTVESLSYFVPDIDNFWHAQSMVMLLGQRLPLHIIILYPVFLYVAVVAVSHMNLRWWAEPCAVGLTALLMDIPFDIMGVKNLWWTWHDDDPNIYDRHYDVPWTSYYFHASFAAAFTLIFFGVRRFFCKTVSKFQSQGFFCEFTVVIITGLFSMPLGILQFIPVYHPLHDLYGLHSEVCVLLFLTFFFLLVWSADRHPFEHARVPKSITDKFNLIALTVLIHLGFYIYIVLTAKPENIKSVGFHQPVGACDVPVDVATPLGYSLKKNKYLCVEHYFEEYFDFHCVKAPPASGKEWYTICGTTYKNHAEYIIVVSAFSFIGLVWFWQLLNKSGKLPKSGKTTVRGVKHHIE